MIKLVAAAEHHVDRLFTDDHDSCVVVGGSNGGRDRHVDDAEALNPVYPKLIATTAAGSDVGAM